MAEGFSQEFAGRVLKVLNNEGDYTMPSLDHLALALYDGDPGVNLGGSGAEINDTGYTAMAIDQSTGGSGNGEVFEVVTLPGASATADLQTNTTANGGDLSWGPAGADWNVSGTPQAIPYLACFGNAGSAPNATRQASQFIWYGAFTGGGATITNGDTAKVTGQNLTISLT